MRASALLLAVIAANASACATKQTAATADFPRTQQVVPGALFSASVETTHTSPGLLRAHARFISTARDTVRFTMGNDWCALTVRAYVGAAVPHQLVWSSDQPPAAGEAPLACGQVLRRVVLAPGASRDFEASYLPRLNLGRPLGPGRYDFTVSVRLLEPEATTPEVAAGRLVIED